MPEHCRSQGRFCWDAEVSRSTNAASERTMPTKTRARERAARPSSLVVLLAMEVTGAVRRHQNLRIGLAEHKFWL